MPSVPSVDWDLARRVARPLSGDLPEMARPRAHAVVASLRLAAHRAGELVADASGMAGEPARTVCVCDRDTWARAAGAMAQDALGMLPATSPGTGVGHALRSAGWGVVAGLALGGVGRHLLGQFDPVASKLFLLAPNIVHLHRQRRLSLDDLGLWVAAHEQTHALQFSAAPWLLDHLTERLAVVALDEVGHLRVAGNVVKGQGPLRATTSDRARRATAEITAVMSLLEGHADFICERVGARHVPSAGRLRAAFARTRPPSVLTRILPVLDKDAQYRDGLAFCHEVAARRGMAGVARAFEGPECLPRPGEIGDPGAWMGRVHGKA